MFTTLVPGLSRTTAMLIFAAIVLAYTFLGGFKAVCWTDFFQGLLMLAALLIIPIVVGFTRTLDFSALSTVYTGPNGEEFKFVASFMNASWKDIISGLGWGLGYFGMPHIIVRFMAIEKPSMVKKSATVAIIWVMLSLSAAILIAYLGRMFVYADGTDLSEVLLSQGQQSLVFVELAREVFPAFIAGLLLAAIIAASMSTADSQLLVAASSFASDLYKPIIRKNASNKEMLWVSRAIVLAIAVIAFFIANSKGKAAQAIMDLVSNAWGIFGAAFGPAVLLSLFWKRFILTAIGGSRGNIHPLLAVKRVRNKLRDEQSGGEVAVNHKADVLLFAAHKSTADVVARIAEVDVHIVAHFSCYLKGMLDQHFAELLPLIFGSNAKRPEGEYLLALTVLVLKPCLGVHDVADDLAVLFKYERKLGNKVGMRAHRMDEIMFVRARLVDIPKRLTGELFNCSIIFFGF